MALFYQFGLAICFICNVHSSRDILFSRQPLCGIEERIEKRCSTEISPVRSLLECLTFCSNKETCLGASLINTFSCYIHESCSEVTECAGEIMDHYQYTKPCENKGTWDNTKGICICVDGWAGPRCNQLPKSCDDLIISGHGTGSYKVTLDLSDVDLSNIEVECRIKATEPTFSYIDIMENSGRIRHDGDWTKYRTGYELSGGHMWLGLEKWYALSLAGYTTLTFRVDFYISRLCEFEWKYYNFRLSSEHEQFAFTFSHASDTVNGCENTDYLLGDCLGPLQNISFSTWDRDHDTEMLENCADEYGAGWWYSNCQGPCHILGWGEGYKNMVPPQRLIDLDGIDMSAMRQNLVSLQMVLQKP